MKRVVLADTGALVALLDRSDEHHDWAVEHFQRFSPPILTCEPVFTETYYLLGTAPPSRTTLAELNKRGLILVQFDFQKHSGDIWKLLAKYQDTPMDFADACLVRMSELHTNCNIWTTDSDFKIYRRMGRAVIPTIAPPAAE